MTRLMVVRLGVIMVVAAGLAGWLVAPALAAGWSLQSTSRASIAYNQGITFDPAQGNFFFDGIRSTTNSGVYRTNSRLSQTAANLAVIPTSSQANPQGYNHAGDLSFDPVQRRLLLPLECYYPSNNPSNTCGSGAFGVVDPISLTFLYYVKLWTPQIQKAMWDEITPDGRWILTSSGTHLLAYNAADVNKQRADYQLQGIWGGLGGKDLGAVLPTSEVAGGAFYVVSGQLRLLLSLNRGTTFQVVSYGIGAAPDGSPVVLSSTPTLEVTVSRSSSNNEPEGLAVTGLVNGAYPLGGALHWLMLPSVTVYSRILNYVPSSGLSSGASRTTGCVVPKLRNRTLTTARRLLLAAHCRLGKVTSRHGARSQRGRVVAQKPGPGAHLRAGARVSLVIGR